MRDVTRPTIVLIMAAVAAMLIDASPAYARRGGGGPGGGGPSAASRSGGHHGPTQTTGNHGAATGLRSGGHGPTAAGTAGANPPAVGADQQQLRSLLRSSGAGHGPQGLSGQPQPSNWQQQAAQQWRQHQAQWRQNHATSGNWQAQGQPRQNAQAWWSNQQNGPQPFTPAWYAQHPNAWHVTHPYANGWAVATTAALSSWLGWAYASEPSYSSTTIVYEDAPEEEEASETVEQVYVDASPSDVALPSGDWLPLGVYSLVASPDQPPMQIVQLSVDRQGVIRGVHYDAMTNTSQNVVGSLDRETQKAQWTLESNPNLAFRTGIDQLTQSEGIVEVSLPSGVQQWHLMRMENTSQ
jgi:hypothetical protein